MAIQHIGDGHEERETLAERLEDVLDKLNHMRLNSIPGTLVAREIRQECRAILSDIIHSIRSGAES